MSRQCRCGHHRSVHRGRNTECIGMVPAGRNALGIKQREFCGCASYRPSERSWWQRRITIGTEESGTTLSRA
jgi:hypothetical protein